MCSLSSIYLYFTTHLNNVSQPFENINPKFLYSEIDILRFRLKGYLQKLLISQFLSEFSVVVQGCLKSIKPRFQQISIF